MSEATRFDEALDRAIAIPSARVAKNVARLRAEHPKASPADIISILERRFVRFSKVSGAGVGIAAAVPAVGTAAAIGITGAQVAAFLGAAATYVLGVAEVHGIETSDVERRRTLLLTALLGQEGANTVQASLGLSGINWARQVLTRLPITTVRSVNSSLRKRAAKTAAKGGGFALGRLAPFGIGAAIGWTGGKTMARSAIDGVRDAFGAAPRAFASPSLPALAEHVD